MSSAGAIAPLCQLDRMEYIQLVEFSIVPTPELEEALRHAGKFGEAAAILTETEGAASWRGPGVSGGSGRAVALEMMEGELS